MHAIRNIGFWSWLGVEIRALKKKWKVAVGVVLALLLVGAAVFFGWGDGLKRAWADTDKFGLILAGVNLVAVGMLGVYQRWQVWQEERPKFLTTVVELPGGDGQIVLLLPFTPLTGLGDLRAQAQAALQSWNENRRLPIEQMLYEVKALGVFQDPEKRLNRGEPFYQHVVRIKWGEPGPGQKNDLLVQWVEAVRESREAMLLLHRHAALALPSQWMYCRISQEEAAKWLVRPVPLYPDACTVLEKVREVSCRRVWLVSRHEATIEWVKGRCRNVERVLDHLDEQALCDLKAVSQRAPETVCVVGNLPPQLIVRVEQTGAQYVHVELNLPLELRGEEVSLQALSEYEPTLTAYAVKRIGSRVVCPHA